MKRLRLLGSSHPWLALITASMAMLLGSFGWLQYQQWRHVENTLVAGHANTSWNFQQFQLEYLRLRHQIDATLHTPHAQAAWAALALRFQIFSSRLDLLQQGDSARPLREHVDYAPLMLSLSRLVHDHEADLGTTPPAAPLRPERLQQLRDMLDRHTSTVHQLLLFGQAQQNLRSTQHLQAIREQVLLTAWSSGVLALLALAFGGIALHQLRLTRQHHQHLQKLHDEVSHRAKHDPLTRLINREEFEHRLQATLTHHTSTHAVLFIDLDRFKVVNDTCGHTAGDRLLREVAALLARPKRASDTLARLGGDEFGVILGNCQLEHALRLAQQMCDTVDAYRFHHGGQRFHIGASIGLVMLQGQWLNTAQVYQAADSACYLAKGAGRNRVHVYQSTDLDLQAYQGQMNWMQRLDSALDENRLRLYWQQIVPLHDGTSTTGVKGEILLRLQEGQDILSPHLFLPAAERFGMASRIDRWVVQTVLHWLDQHRSMLTPLESLSINLSGQSIGDPAFQHYVLEQLQQHDLPLHKLVFEITETAAITNFTASQTFIQALRKLGVQVALDDFGSGMSSFGYLKELAVDHLKIDGQFLRNLTQDHFDQVTTRAICDVGRATGRRTTAEWIENEETAAMLRSMGVDFGQGFLWHQPESLERLLSQLRGRFSPSSTAAPNHLSVQLAG